MHYPSLLCTVMKFSLYFVSTMEVNGNLNFSVTDILLTRLISHFHVKCHFSYRMFFYIDFIDSYIISLNLMVMLSTTFKL